MKKTTLPVCASMCIGPPGDARGISVEECAVRMARAGADVIGKCVVDSLMLGLPLLCIGALKLN